MKKNIFIFILFLIGTLNLSAQIKSSVEYPDSVFNGKIDIVYVFEVNDDIDSIKSLFYDKDKIDKPLARLTKKRRGKKPKYTK